MFALSQCWGPPRPRDWLVAAAPAKENGSTNPAPRALSNRARPNGDPGMDTMALWVQRVTAQQPIGLEAQVAQWGSYQKNRLRLDQFTT